MAGTRSDSIAAFPVQRIWKQAIANQASLLLLTALFMIRQGIPMGQWAYFVGEKLAPAWPHGQTARQLATQVALNVASAGAADVAITGDDDAATTCFRWPLDDLISLLDLNPQEASALWTLFEWKRTVLGAMEDV